MKCIRCNSDESTDMYFVETFPCPHCDDELEVQYHICKSCHITWKVVGDNVVSMADFEDDVVFARSDEDFFEAFTHISTNEILTGPVMGELVHRCIRCGSIAFEIADKKWRCNDPECQFEWEVLAID